MSFGAVASAGDPLKRGLVGWYRMLGNANDSSGRGNTGTLVASPTTTTDKYGNADAAYTFNGSSQYISLTQNSGLPLYSQNGFSVAMWVKGASQFGTVFSEGSTSGNNPIVLVYAGSSSASTKFSAYVRNSNLGGYWHGTFAAGGVNSTADAFNNSWNHIAVTYTRTTQVMYVNGASSGSATSAGLPASLGLTMNRSAIGVLLRSSAAVYFNGSLSDVRLYNRTLTADEVGTLFRATQRI